MIGSSKDGRVSAAFMTLATRMTSEYDVVELLHTLMGECVELLDVQAAGLLLADGDGRLELVASTSEAAAFVEIMQLNAGAGPCIESFETGEVISIPDVTDTAASWTQFRKAALREGYRSAHAVPLRVRSQTIGAMGLFRSAIGGLDRAEAAIAHALASIGSIGILQERVLRESALVTDQLQRALDSRVVIEQAKGVLAASADVDMEEAFRLLRDHARRNNLSLHAVARAIVDRSLRLPAADRRAS